jgi:hypothetical protein
MGDLKPKVNYKNWALLLVKKLYNLLAPRAHSAIMHIEWVCSANTPDGFLLISLSCLQ